MTSPFSAVTPDQEQTALESITKMMTGTQMLKDEPGVVYSLAQEQAHPADAGAIDQFMQGLDAEKQVRIAQAAGTKITLSPEQKTLLSGLNVDYSGVEYTQQNATQDTIAKYASQGQKVKTNPDGSLALDASGNVQVEQPHKYKAKGIGRLFQTLHNDVLGPAMRDGITPTLHGMNDAWNVVDSTYGAAATGLNQASKDLGVVGDALNPVQAVHQIWDSADGKSVQLAPKFGKLTTDLRSAVGGTDDQIQQMRDAGYDPTNFFSAMAYRAKGLAHSDLSPLAKQWEADHPNTEPFTWDKALAPSSGQEAVQAALALSENPKKYRQSIENDPTLSPDQVAAKIKYISSPDFKNLVRKVQASRSSIGNAGAYQLGLDPVKHPDAFTAASAGIDLAASFMIDPTILAGKLVKFAKLRQIGLDGLGDINRATANLERAAAVNRAEGVKGAIGRVTNLYSNRLAQGVNRAIDLSGQIRAASDAGDKAAEAALTAKFAAELPEYQNVLADFIGKHAFMGLDEAAKPIFGATGGIRSIEDFSSFIGDRVGMIRLMNGRAAVQASLMPGSLSNFGVRKLRGLTSGWATGRSAARALSTESEAISRLAADPAKRQEWITEGDLIHTQPQADDAVNAVTDEIIAHTGEATASTGGLASAQRGALTADDFALTPKGKGVVTQNVRATGDVLGDGSIMGRLSPTAVAARARLSSQRFTKLLARNNLIDIEDPRSGEIVNKIALTYLSPGQSRMLQAAYNTGNGGQREVIVQGLMDQLGHAAGLSKLPAGQRLLDTMKTQVQAYSSVGDEVIIDGQNVALHPGQVRTKFQLPSFRDMHHAAAKIGLWDATMGRAMSSHAADTLGSLWKVLALLKPSTMSRNLLEGWLRVGLEGGLGDALKSRVMLTMPKKELWARGFALDSKIDYERLLADGDLKGAKALANSTKLDTAGLGRSKPGAAAAHFLPFALAGKAYRSMYGSHVTENDLRMLETLGDAELGEFVDGFGQQIAGDIGYRRAARDASEISKAGFGPVTLKSAMKRGFDKAAKDKPSEGSATQWVPDDTMGEVGASRYANALAQRINPAPSITRAVLDHIENPAQFDISHIVKALDDPAVARKMNLVNYGKWFWEDGSDVPRRATSDAEVLLGKQEWARKLVNDYAHLLTGQNGEYQDGLANEIRQTGKAPDVAWIDKHLSGDNRPHAVLAPQVMAMPNGGTKGIIAGLLDVMGAGFEWMVERPLQRTTSSPAFLANYIRARSSLEPTIARMVETGVSPEAAGALAKELSVRNAWVKAEQLIDDPGQKSQFDVVARNMFPFSRAMQAMVRRWGSGLWQDPTRARKMMLAYEGAVQSGLVYTNTYGEPTFTYPGSGVMNMLLREVAKVPGLESLARFPVSASMTGGVLMSVPGADNPLRMSMGPMISVPMREIFKLFPSQRETLDKVDAAINGPIGVGETWTQFLPGAARKIVTALNTDQRNSALASSTIGAISNLGAAGLVPGVGASKSERDAFFKRVQQQTQNQLYLRAIFGMFSPASPSTPSEGTAGSQADYAFHVQGIGQLSDEYKTILNDVHGDLARANAIFTALHPDSAVWYETGHSQANASKVALPSTADALNWMAKNAGFISKYNSVAAYFLPESTGNQPFDEQAYKAQLELGLRQRKTPSEFYSDVRVRNAESVFYPTVDAFNQRIAEAKKSGNDAIVRQLTDQKSQWETNFKNLNPLFGAKIDGYSDARAQAKNQLSDLKKMVADGSVPDGYGPLLSNLIAAYDGLVAFQQQHPGSTNEATAMKQQAQGMFDSWVTSNVANTPLADLYSGVFRTLDTNLVNLSAPGGN